jgi:hypothetical protein
MTRTYTLSFEEVKHIVTEYLNTEVFKQTVEVRDITTTDDYEAFEIELTVLGE